MRGRGRAEKSLSKALWGICEDVLESTWRTGQGELNLTLMIWREGKGDVKKEKKYHDTDSDVSPDLIG